MRQSSFSLLFVALLVGIPTSVSAQTLDIFPKQFELNSLHEGRQILVTVTGRDATRDASYSVSPAGIVRVSTNGYVRPIRKGEAIIHIERGGQKREVRVTVRAD